MIAEIIKDLNIFLISQSKLDSTFPNAQFKVTGFKIFKYDRNRFGGVLLLYVNDKTPSKFLNKHSISSDIELIALEFHQTNANGFPYVFLNLQTKMIWSLWKQLVQLLTKFLVILICLLKTLIYKI